MQGVELEIDLTDVLHLIQQFCLENNLLSSFQALQNESKVSYTAISSVQDLIHNIHTGKWDLVLAQCEPLSLSADCQVDLYEQIVLELIEEREVALARSILRGSKAMNLLRERDGERYLRLEYLVPCQSPLAKDEMRKKLAKKIVNEISLVPSGRLISLLKIAALQEQRGIEKDVKAGDHEPKDFEKGNSESFVSHYDLFRGTLRSLASEEFSCSLHKSISLPENYTIESIAFSPTGTFFAMGTSNGCIQLWNPLTASIPTDLPFQSKNEFMHHDADSAILSLAFSADAIALLASADEKGNCKVWSCTTGAEVATFPNCHQSGITSVSWNAEASQLLTSSYDKTCKILSLKTGAVLRVFRGHESWVSGAVYSVDWSSIYSTSSDGTCRIWNVASGECTKIVRPAFNALSFIVPVQNSFLIGGSSTLLINSKGTIEQTLEMPSESQLLHCALSGRGDFFFGITSAFELAVFDSCTGTRTWNQKISPSELICIAVHPISNVAVVASVEGKVYFFKTNAK